MTSRAPATGADPFVAHRNLLFTVAYEMLGSAADAEDVVQETWLRWSSVSLDDVREPRAYLVRIVTRQALNHLRTVSWSTAAQRSHDSCSTSSASAAEPSISYATVNSRLRCSTKGSST